MARGLSNKHKEDEDAEQIDFPRSDGTTASRPQDPPPPSDGSINMHRVLGARESTNVSWRKKIGEYLAEHLNLPGHKKKSFILASFPDGYEFFDHLKGQPGNPRHDAYLYGSRTVTKFRSANEFFPHALWLFNDSTMNTSNCGCKYCSKTKSQREVSDKFGLKMHPGPINAPSSPSKTSPPKRILPPPTIQYPEPPNPDSPQRIADLRAQRTFRPGELVWTTLKPAIPGPDGNPKLCIDVWPAIVHQVLVKSRATKHEIGEPYTVEQIYGCKVKLLGVEMVHMVPESDVIPYLGRTLDDALVEVLRDGEPDPSTYTEDLKEFNSFRPSWDEKALGPDGLPKDPPKFSEAHGPFSLAIQIAVNLSKFWTPTHPWEFSYQPPAPAPLPPPPPGPPEPGSSKDALIVSTTASEMITETRYQGLWWGAERIWAGDLVRIKPTRANLCTVGGNDLPEPAPSSESIGMFMLLSAIYFETSLEDGNLRYCKISGPIYELAEETWVDEEMEKRRRIIKDLPVRAASISPSSSTPGPSLAPPSHPPPMPSIHTFMSAPIPPLSAEEIDPAFPTGFNLPEAPLGFKYRPLLLPHQEISLAITMLSGRYYPKLLESETFHPSGVVEITQNNISAINKLLSLGGLSPGWVKAMDCQDWKAGRRVMFADAEEDARREIYEFWTKRPPNGMDI